MLGAPGSVPVLARRSRDGSALVTVTCRFPAGAGAPSDAEIVDCRSLPIARLPTLIAGCSTVAVICVKFDGVENPAGCSIEIVVVPGATGWKDPLTTTSPPPNRSGELAIVPTAGMLLVITTDAAKPPRSDCEPWYTNVPGNRRAASTRTGVGFARVFVLMLPALMMNPDGWNVTVLRSLT